MPNFCHAYIIAVHAVPHTHLSTECPLALTVNDSFYHKNTRINVLLHTTTFNLDDIKQNLEAITQAVRLSVVLVHRLSPSPTHKSTCSHAHTLNLTLAVCLSVYAVHCDPVSLSHPSLPLSLPSLQPPSRPPFPSPSLLPSMFPSCHLFLPSPLPYLPSISPAPYRTFHPSFCIGISPHLSIFTPPSPSSAARYSMPTSREEIKATNAQT